MATGDQTMWASIDDLKCDVKELLKNGCAKREGDLRRIESVEHIVDSHGKKLDKIFYTSLVTAGGIIAFLIKTLIPGIIAK